MSGPGLYRYFDDLNGIAKALAMRNLTRFLEKANEELAKPDLEWQDALTNMVTLYSGLYRTEPGFRWLRLGDSVSRTLIDGTESNKSVLAKNMSDVFVQRFEVDYRADLQEHIEVMVEIVDGLLAKAFETNPDGNPFFISETARVINGYLEEYLARPYPKP